MVGKSWAAAARLGMLAGSASGAERLWSNSKQRHVQRQRSEIAQVARQAMSAVVSITTVQSELGSGAEPQKGLGSGFLIHPDGYVLTSAHVIEDATEIQIAVDAADGRPENFHATVIGQDPGTDVALLKIDAPRKLPVLRLSSASKVSIAAPCILHPASCTLKPEA